MLENKVNYCAINFIIHWRIILLSRTVLNGVSVLPLINSVSIKYNIAIDEISLKKN